MTNDRSKPVVIDESAKLAEADTSPQYDAKPPVEVSSDIFAPALDTKRFKRALDHRTANRQILIEWIRDNLVEGIDYGRIHVVKKTRCSLGRQCTDPSHWSKPSLWKPGAEKICGMMGWTPTFPNLGDYLLRAKVGKPIEQVLLRCVVYDRESHMMGEGTGARHVSQDAIEGRVDLNKTMKMCEKSAMADAVLRAAGLSEIFTQDMEPGTGDDPIDPYAPGATAGANPWANTNNIDVETHCPIGRDSKGKAWSDVDLGMLRWIEDHCKDKPQLIERVQREIADREKKRAERDMQDADADPTRQPKGRPEEGGSLALGEYARRVIKAETLDELNEAWSNVPDKFVPALRREHQKRLAILEAHERKAQRAKGDADEPPQ